jgi:hypothetical protein
VALPYDSYSTLRLFRRSMHAVPNARLGARIGVTSERASKAPIPSVARSGLSGASPYQFLICVHLRLNSPFAVKK